MTRTFRTQLSALGCVAAALVAAGCSGSDPDCLLDGSCDAVACDPEVKPDTCTASDATKVCHPDDKVCAAMCMADTDCTTAGQKCDLVAMACRDASKITDCTVAGSECATDKVCDAAGTKSCIDPCTKDGFVCAAGLACNPTSKLCEKDCTADGAVCAEGQRCDAVAKVCVAKCGEGTCTTDQFCGTDGACAQRCDAAADPAVCGPDTYCEIGGSGRCLPACYLEVNPTVCNEDEFCQDVDTAPKFGQCVAKCKTNADCAAGAGFCGTSGKCEDRKTWSECKPAGTPPAFSFYDAERNVCAPVTAAAGPEKDNRDSNKPVSAEGPVAYSATFLTYQDVADAECTGKRAKIAVAYYDFEGDFPTSNANNAFDLGIRLAAGTTNGDDDSYSNTTPTLDTGATATSGIVFFTLCRANATTEKTFTLFLRDAGSTKHYGNSFDVTVPAI